MEKLSRKEILYWIYWFGLAVIAASLPLSKYTMSIGQFLVLGAWMTDGFIQRDLHLRFVMFFKNKAALALSSFYLLHIAGLTYTEDFGYALQDLQLKITMLMLPVVIATSPIMDQKNFRWLLIIHILAVLTGTLLSTYILATRFIADLRDIFPFISHIRFGLNIDMAVFSLVYLIFYDRFYPGKIRVILLLLLIWLIVFLALAELVTGLVILVISFSAMVLYVAVKKNLSWLKLSWFLLAVGIPVGVFYYIQNITDQIWTPRPVDLKTLEASTPQGNPYFHDTAYKQIENGYLIYINIQYDELREAWNGRSRLDYDGKDLKGQELKTTLIRFLTSKGLKKDADGVKALTDLEITAVENGIVNTVYLSESSLKVRIYETLWEFYALKFNPDPSGRSLIQRFEFWKASWRIFVKNWLIGTGTGDVKNAFRAEYEEMKTLLAEQYRWRSHNQYLSVLVTFGLPGILVFMFSLFYPLRKTGNGGDYFVFTILSITLLSMITEDTLENQAGCTFFYFFYTLFLFGKRDEHRVIRP